MSLKATERFEDGLTKNSEDRTGSIILQLIMLNHTQKLSINILISANDKFDLLVKFLLLFLFCSFVSPIVIGLQPYSARRFIFKDALNLPY